MKTKVTIVEVTKEDITNLLSTAASGSTWLGLSYDSIEWEEYILKGGKKEDCLEDIMANLLLDGRKVELYDMEAVDETDFFGNLEHYYDDCGNMCYLVSLDNIKEGLERAANSDEGWIRDCFKDLMEDDSYNMDQPEAEALIQYILFGELIYG